MLARIINVQKALSQVYSDRFLYTKGPRIFLEDKHKDKVRVELEMIMMKGT